MTNELEIDFKGKIGKLKVKRDIKIEGGCRLISKSKFKFNPMEQARRVTQL